MPRSWKPSAAVLVTGLVTASVGGVAEFMFSGGTSTWTPLLAGIVGAVAAWLVFLAFFNQATDGRPLRNAAELMDTVPGNLTQIETDNLFKDHKDRRVQVSGGVEGVIELPGRLRSRYMVEVAMPGPVPRLASAYFGPRWASKVRTLKVGDQVSLDGKILDIDPYMISLVAARLRPVDDD